MGKSIIITVGTSLLGEAKGVVAVELRNLMNENPSNTLELFQNKVEDLICKKDGNIQYALSVLLERWTAAQSESASMEDFRSLSAELASLARFASDYPLGKVEDQIHLVCSDSHAGWLSGRLIQLFLKDNVVNDTNLHPVVGLKARDERSFKDVGLRNLVDKIAELSRQAEGEAFIIATGGYKAGSVYGSLMGMLCQRPIYYLHEEFQENIDLPVLPIHLDFDLWRENAERIELILSLPEEHAKPFYQILDTRIQRLMQLEDNSDFFRWTPAGEMLYRAYKDASGWSQFQVGGRSLLFHLQRDDLKSRYGRYLREISEYIWLGDKVSEMVDHALKHHHNLFEFGEMFLVPMLHNNPDFISSEEVYILLCVILLHDCGHSLNTFPSLPNRLLLPTEIRNWHHILGYERLNPDYFKAGGDRLLLELASIWKGKPADQETMREFWEDELRTIATIGLYHRRDMPLTDKKYRDDLLPTKRTVFAPLSTEKLFLHRCRFTENALKIAAIFRIIDSCDLQVSRLGSEQEQRLKLGVIAADVRAETKREKDVVELLSVVSGLADIEQLKNALEDEIETGRELYRKKERSEFKDDSEKKQLNSKIQEAKKMVGEIINDIKEQDKRRMVQMAVDMRREVSNRLDFKKEQGAHFARAAKVKKVSVAYSLTKSMNKFVITIKGSTKDKEFLEGLKCNMIEEYEKVQAVLSRYKIVVDYELDLV